MLLQDVQLVLAPGHVAAVRLPPGGQAQVAQGAPDVAEGDPLGLRDAGGDLLDRAFPIALPVPVQPGGARPADLLHRAHHPAGQVERHHGQLRGRLSYLEQGIQIHQLVHALLLS